MTASSFFSAVRVDADVAERFDGAIDEILVCIGFGAILGQA